LEGVEAWYLEQLNFLEQYKNDKAKYDKALEQLEQARLVKRADINTKYDIELAVERQKFEENYTKFLEKQEQERLQQTLEALKEREDKTAYLQESFRIKQQEIEDKYKELLEEARIMEDEQALANLQALKDAELEIIKNTHEAEIKMNEEALEQMRKDRNRAAILMNVEYSERILGGLSQIFASMSQMSEENSKQQKTLAMVSLALNQAAAMGAAVRAAIDGAKDMPDPISKIAYFVTTLATFMGIIASTISQAKQIANSGNIGAGGGINPALTNNVNQNYNAVQENRATELPPQQVYVLESDITNTQNRIRRINVNQVL
jgi:DNA repair exonuclease SbcCD ATPase subunit